MQTLVNEMSSEERFEKRRSRGMFDVVKSAPRTRALKRAGTSHDLHCDNPAGPAMAMAITYGPHVGTLVHYDVVYHPANTYTGCVCIGLETPVGRICCSWRVYIVARWKL